MIVFSMVRGDEPGWRSLHLMTIRPPGAYGQPCNRAEEVTLETAELAMLEGKGNRLSPDELGLLAKDLAAAKDAAGAGRIRERLNRGFYGV
jgi:hypothetical protein